MSNISLNRNLTSPGTILMLIAIVICSIVILFDFVIIIVVTYHGKFTKHCRKNNSRRVGLLHSINTYIHLIGILSTLLIMCIQTLYNDLHQTNRVGTSVPWHCHFLAYLITLFAAGVYGSCFLQALFRFWRIMIPNRDLFQRLSFHISLIVAHWIIIIVLSLPVTPRSIYISSDHFCLTPFDDRWAAAYISCVTAVLPVAGIFILYIKIVIYMKHHVQSRKKLKRMKRDISAIRRILLLVAVILQTSSMGIILWILTLFDKRLHSIFYRLLRFLIILCMSICSVTLFMVSPQLKRLLRSNAHRHQKKCYIQKQNVSSNNIPMEELTPTDTLSVS